MAASPSRTSVATGRGRIDKREAILDAAFRVFAREGYALASMREIAKEAAVAKPTIYNHLGDKDTLFLHAMSAAAESVLSENLQSVETLRDPGDDLPGRLSEVARSLAATCCGDRAQALRRLTYGQIATVPELLDAVPARTSGQLAEALADRFARLSLSGRLRSCDPSLAAEHFLALITGPLEARSALGTREVDPDEAERIASAAVDTFLRAYGSASSDH